MRKEMMPFVLSLAGILILLAHFWLAPPASIALWATSAILGISSVHQGMRVGAQMNHDEKTNWMPKAASRMGWLILLGCILSAIFLLVPRT